MGCDIHIYVERVARYVGTDDEQSAICLMHEDVCYDDRNYRLFSWLAGVRQYAEPGESDYIEPLSQPRGLPADLSPGVKRSIDNWGADLHSKTWFTLKELLEVPVVPEYAQRFFIWLSTLHGEGAEAAQHGSMGHYKPETIRLIIGFDN